MLKSTLERLEIRVIALSVLFKRFAHSAEPRHLGCSVVDLLGLCLCAGLWVCVFLFFRSWFVLFGVACVPFGALWGYFGLHFWALGVPWALF